MIFGEASTGSPGILHVFSSSKVSCPFPKKSLGVPKCSKPSITAEDGQAPTFTRICWRHAADLTSTIQILHSGGIRPAAITDEQDFDYHWSPPFYCRVDVKHVLQDVNHEKYVNYSRVSKGPQMKRTQPKPVPPSQPVLAFSICLAGMVGWAFTWEKLQLRLLDPRIWSAGWEHFMRLSWRHTLYIFLEGFNHHVERG